MKMSSQELSIDNCWELRLKQKLRFSLVESTQKRSLIEVRNKFMRLETQSLCNSDTGVINIKAVDTW